MAKVDFHYIKTGTGELSGPSFVTQTELAINELGTYWEQLETELDATTATADKALAQATDAGNTAAAALLAAQNAQVSADAAQTSADAAQASANKAQASADAAQTTADGKAPVYHASEQNTYGLGTDELYGHVMLSDALDNTTGVAATAGTAASSAAAAALNTLVTTAQTTADAKAPIYHASEEATYGLGTDELYGHVKLTDALDDSTDTAISGSGVAATPAAVASVKELADTAQDAADAAQATADSALASAYTNADNITTLNNTIESLQNSLVFSSTKTAIDGNSYAEAKSKLLYLTTDAEAGSTNLPEGCTFPLYLWANKADSGLAGIVYVLDGNNTLYSRIATGVEATETTTDEETGEETTTTTVTWTYSDWHKITQYLATTAAAGIVKPDGDTISVTDGTISINKSLLSTVYKFKGSVETAADLPADAAEGDVYNVTSTGVNYAWNGTAWDNLGGIESVDATPTQSSANPVSSGGVYDALSALQTDVAAAQADISTNAAGVAENKASITTLQTETVASLSSKIEALETALASAQDKIAALEAEAGGTTVLQAVSSASGNYPLILAKEAGQSADVTASTNFAAGITANPAAGTLTANNIFGTAQAVIDGAIDVTSGSCFTATVAADTTFSFTGLDVQQVACFSLILTNGGAYTVTWPSSVKWADGAAPELQSAGVDVLTFLTADSGATWYGSVSVKGAV